MKPKVGMMIEHTGKKLTKPQLERGKIAQEQKEEKGKNPASWVGDEDVWDKAKKAADKTYDREDDAYWPAVTHIYENMGGEVKSVEPLRAANPEGHNQYSGAADAADKASDKAWSASGVTHMRSSGEEEHAQARDAHMQAFRAHKRAASLAEHPQYHANRAEEHRQKAIVHNEDSGERKVPKSHFVKGSEPVSAKVPGKAQGGGNADGKLTACTNCGAKDVQHMTCPNCGEDEQCPQCTYCEHCEKEINPATSTVKLTEPNSWRNETVRAAHGEITGKPSFRTLESKVNKAIQEDPRWDTDKHGQPEGSMGDYEPYVVDILVPDDDGGICAVIRTDDGRLVKHYFEWDGENVTLDDGNSEPTEVTQVYAKQIKEMEKDRMVKAAGSKEGADKGHAMRKSASADMASKDAHEASAEAHESGDDKDHDHAADAHETAAMKHEAAYKAHAKAGGNEEQMKHHMDAMQAHKAMAKMHAGDEEDDDTKAREPVLHARASTKLPDNADGDFEWMPGGVSTITATYRNRPITMSVECDEATASTVQASFDAHVKASPRRPPFGCVEHREEEATFHPKAFTWKDDPEPGVYCSAEWTPLGLRNVRGKIHTSFSPSFTTDAEYSKAVCASCKRTARTCECDGELSFPDGVRGSESNPAQVTGVSHKSVGSLTNWPAFKNILPVKAKQADTPPGNQGELKGKLTMKVRMLRARGSHAAGTTVELQDNDAVLAISAKDAMDFDTWEELEKVRASRKAESEKAVKDAIVKCKSVGGLAPKDEEFEKTQLARLAQGVPLDVIIDIINAMSQTKAAPMRGQLPGVAGLFERHTTSIDGNGETRDTRIELLSADPRDIGTAYLKAREPMQGLIRGGDLLRATNLSIETSAMLKAHLLPLLAKHGDVMLRDLVRASDTSDPNSQVGTLATGLVLMRNLGYLKNKLGWMPYISTDLRNEPALYGQTILTRYITPPNVLTYVPGIGYTSDATTINAAGLNVGGSNYASGMAPTQTSGTRTPSVPSTTDRSVVMNRNRGVEIVFPTSTLGSTMRNLFGEQQGAQFYSLAEQVNKDFLLTVTGSTWTGIIGDTYALGSGFGLPGIINLKTRFTANKMPDVGRFVLLHSFYHDNVLADSNLVSAKAITALVNKDLSAFESGELPLLYGIKILESQLAAASNSTTLVVPSDPTTIASTASFFVGLAGNMASMLFVARVPQDYTKVFPDVPATAAIEILTEPDSGLSILFTKYVDHALAQVSARCALMYGFAQGDPRQGFRLTP